MKRSRPIITAAVLIVFVIVAVISYFSSGSPVSSFDTIDNLQTENTIVVNFLDVGQGDSEFIQLPNGKCMLIDASTAEYGEEISDKISSLGYEKIDYLVATHPHADHIGGMIEIVNDFEIGEVYMPRAQTDTKTYENLLTAMSDKELSVTAAAAGKLVFSEGDLMVELLAPVSEKYDDLNNYSAVVKLDYGNNSFLFMGDAEEVSEREILNSLPKEQLKADVVKVGHHGSSSSSCEDFVYAVSPDYAVFEVGAGNSYGHPHSESLERWQRVGAEILRTDLQGDISVVSDGNDLTVVSERN